MMTLELATELLAGLTVGDRVAVKDPRATNCRGQWTNYWVVEDPAINLPTYRRCQHGHATVSLRVWQHTKYVDQLAACHLIDPSQWVRKEARVWQPVEGAKHIVSATGLEDRDTGQTWQSTVCGELLETTGGRSWGTEHITYPTYGRHSDRITCPGCRLRNGLDLEVPA